MSAQVQYRRGTDTQNDAFTGAIGEITVDTTSKTLRVHDGATQGGSNIATVAYVDNQISNIDANLITFGNTSMNIASSNANIVANVEGTEMAVFSASGLEITGTSSATTVVATGNVIGGNLVTTGVVSVTGNVSAGNVSGTTGTFTDVGGTLTTAAQPNITSVGTLTSLSVTGNANSGNLIATNKIESATLETSSDGTIGGNLIVTGNLTVNGTTTTINSTTLTVDDLNVVLADGAADASAANGAGLTVDGANATFTYASSGDKWTMNKNLDISTNNIDLGGITNNNADGVGNIGSTTTAFNTVFAKATSAQYADLAEKYESDAEYNPGTVIAIGGEKEVTQSGKYADSRVVGVVSTNPAHIMNSNIQADISIDVALTGRVPCQVVGNINKGDVLTSSEIPGVATKLIPESFVPGCILGKALEDYSGTLVGTIEVLVGKS